MIEKILDILKFIEPIQNDEDLPKKIMEKYSEVLKVVTSYDGTGNILPVYIHFEKRIFMIKNVGNRLDYDIIKLMDRRII
jgi:hypothetical protein